MTAKQTFIKSNKYSTKLHKCKYGKNNKKDDHSYNGQNIRYDENVKKGDDGNFWKQDFNIWKRKCIAYIIINNSDYIVYIQSHRLNKSIMCTTNLKSYIYKNIIYM